MRTVAVAVVLGVVLLASALDLALGLIWSTALVAVLLLRRRIRPAAWLVLLAVTGLLVWGGRLGWLAPPAPRSYTTGWVPAWGESRSAPASAGITGDPEILAARRQLAMVAREELRLTGPELEQRAGAVIALIRRLDPLRNDAPREVAAVESAARRLARTLAAAEFRDLERRRAGAAAYLADVDRRLSAARDASEVASILRATDPAAMALVSLRPVREDLGAASGAVEGLVRVLGGGVPAAATTATADYEEGRREIRWEVRHTVSGAPGIRLLRLETRALRAVAPSGVPLSLTYVPGGEPARPVPPGPWLELEPAPRGVGVVAAWSEPAAPRPVHERWRWLTFEGLSVEAPRQADDTVLTVVLDGRPGLEMPLVVPLPTPRLTQVAVPRHALYFANRPGAVLSDPERDRWELAGVDTGSSIGIELVPERLLLRNAAFAWVSGYLYRPNLTTIAVAAGLAALTLVLVRRPRPKSVEAR